MSTCDKCGKENYNIMGDECTCEVDALEARVELLTRVVNRCACVFKQYMAIHRAKIDSSKIILSEEDKANLAKYYRNKAHHEMCLAALKDAPEITEEMLIKDGYGYLVKKE